MKETTNKILSKLISFDNCINKSSENQRLNEIIVLCEEHIKHDVVDQRRFNQGRAKVSIDVSNVPDGFCQIKIPGKDYLIGYYVNKEGKIFSAKTQIYMKLSKSKAGYLQFGITHKGKLKFIMVHKAVACTFLENPNDYPIIHHKDHDKTNNSVDNLEWCTHRNNSNYYHSLIKSLPEYKG